MAWGVETVKTTISVTISREGSIEVGELSVYCFTNSLGEKVKVESFQNVSIPGKSWPCEKLRPQRDPRLKVQRERNHDGTDTWTLLVPDGYPLVIFHRVGYFEQFEGHASAVLYRPQLPNG